jgi:hypothetical protein
MKTINIQMFTENTEINNPLKVRSAPNIIDFPGPYFTTTGFHNIPPLIDRLVNKL